MCVNLPPPSHPFLSSILGMGENHEVKGVSLYAYQKLNEYSTGNVNRWIEEPSVTVTTGPQLYANRNSEFVSDEQEQEQKQEQKEGEDWRDIQLIPLAIVWPKMYPQTHVHTKRECVQRD